MVNPAAFQADVLPDANPGIAAEILTSWRERSLLWQRRDLDGALASFTFIADVTTLAKDCRFVGDSRTLVVRYDGLPFAAIAFCQETWSISKMSSVSAGSPAPDTLSITRDRTPPSDDIVERIVTLTRRLVAPDETFTCLVAEDDRPLLEAAYQVLEVHPEWQMMFCGDSMRLDPGDTVTLEPSDVPKMRALARREGMQAFARDPLTRGPWYGVWRYGKLVAQGGTHLLLDQAAEIGNIVTAKAYRRQGYGSQVVAALLRELSMQGYTIFLHVLKANEAALAFYEGLGFERQRTMLLTQCRV